MTNTRNYHVALSRNVKALRAARGWSLEQLAKHSMLSRAMIVQVEGARTNASIGTIVQLAEALAVPVQALLEIPESSPISVVPAGDGTKLWSDRRGSWARLMSGMTAGDRQELWQWRLAAGARYEAEAHSPGTRETLWVHRGALTVRVGDAAATAGEGDTIRFEARSPHRYQNAGRAVCEFSMVVQLP